MKSVKKIILLAFGILFIQFGIAQVDHSEYFSVSEEDKKRWKIYSKFIEKFEANSDEKADSVFSFAKIEYQKGQFSKSRELCELANKLNPKLSKTYLLIGKAYASSAKICLEDDSHKIKEAIIWAAIDEWEKSISLTGGESEAKLLIERYSEYLPTEKHFRSCFTDSTAKEGDEYFVNCWIQRTTKIRFKRE